MGETLRPAAIARYPQLCISTVVGITQAPTALSHAGALVTLLLGGLIPLLTHAPAAYGQAWQLSGPRQPPAGESATYRLRGPPGLPYRALVFTGTRSCPGDGLPGEPAQILKRDGYLNANGTDTQQLSVAPGRSTICIYGGYASTLVAATVTRTSPGRDRLRIGAIRQRSFPADDAVITATGYIGRRGDADATTDAADEHVGKLIIAAQLGDGRCPTSPPVENASRTSSGDIYTARFSEHIVLDSAFDVSSTLRLCGYLTAQRRVPGDVRTRTVARATTTVSGSGRDKDGQDGGGDVIFGGVLAWILVGLLIAAISAVIRWIANKSRTTTVAPRTRPPTTPSPGQTSPATPHPPERGARGTPPVAQPAATTAEIDAPQHAERPRRRAKPRDVIQDAVEAVADTYRDRLQALLEHQDGPRWLDALNQRREESMIQAGKHVPQPYEFLEPRAVLNCLAYDPAGLQLVPAHATKSAKQLSGLVNDAHHPKPQAPLAEADGYRAWQLYTDITGHTRPGDPFDR